MITEDGAVRESSVATRRRRGLPGSSAEDWPTISSRVRGRMRTASGARWSRLRSDRVRGTGDRKSTRLNSSHVAISYAVFCLKKKKRAKLERLVTHEITNDHD